MDVLELVARLPRYTVLAGHSGTSTTWLLAQLASRFAEAPGSPRTVLLDPKGDAERLVARALKGTTGNVDVLAGADASVTSALSLLVDAPPGSSLLIDNAWRPLTDEPACRELDSHIRNLRSRGQRVVIQAHGPEDLQRIPQPELLCVFPLMWRTPEWAAAYPSLARCGVLSWAGFDRPGARGRCLVADDRGTVLGAIEVGPEPTP